MKFPGADDSAVMLFKAMVRLDPKSRVSAAEALSSDSFDRLPV